MKWRDETEAKLSESAETIAEAASQLSEKAQQMEPTEFKHRAEGLQFLGATINHMAHGGQGGNQVVTHTESNRRGAGFG